MFYVYTLCVFKLWLVGICTIYYKVRKYVSNICMSRVRVYMTNRMLNGEIFKFSPQLGSANRKIESHEFSLRLLQYVDHVKVFLKPP